MYKVWARVLYRGVVTYRVHQHGMPLNEVTYVDGDREVAELAVLQRRMRGRSAAQRNSCMPVAAGKRHVGRSICG